MHVELARKWALGERIGGGGFGQVFAATSVDGDAGPSVAKLVPKGPGAQRELLFVYLDGFRNIVPIFDSGETEDHWVLIMPRASASLRQQMAETAGPMDVATALPVLVDIATALKDLSGKVVHRDIKPENVLLLGERWCLADFGISRYAEATTAADTQKYALSAPYAAPERWRGERATGAADVYALGIIAFELLSGALPFVGKDLSDFRDLHLHADPQQSPNIPVNLMALITECLYKSAGARPSPENLLLRLAAAANGPSSAARSRLQQVNMGEVARHGQSARRASENRSEAEKRNDLLRDAASALQTISNSLKGIIVADAPAANLQTGRACGWSASIGQARLDFSDMVAASNAPWEGWQPPRFDVVAYASIRVRVSAGRTGYEGRSHSLWFCDAREAGRYSWFETAFMVSPLVPRSISVVPFALDLGEGAAKALWQGLAEFQLAWPFTPLAIDDLTSFLDRWLNWFADAAEGRLQYPSMMPERPAEGSWRR